MSHSHVEKAARHSVKSLRQSRNRWGRQRVLDLGARHVLDLRNTNGRETRYPWCAIEGILIDSVLGMPGAERDFPPIERGDHRIVMSVVLDPYSRAILKWDFRVVFCSSPKAPEVDHGV